MTSYQIVELDIEAVRANDLSKGSMIPTMKTLYYHNNLDKTQVEFMKLLKPYTDGTKYEIKYVNETSAYIKTLEVGYLYNTKTWIKNIAILTFEGER